MTGPVDIPAIGLHQDDEEVARTRARPAISARSSPFNAGLTELQMDLKGLGSPRLISLACMRFADPGLDLAYLHDFGYWTQRRLSRIPHWGWTWTLSVRAETAFVETGFVRGAHTASSTSWCSMSVHVRFEAPGSVA